jgi:15-cis-phytoene synthase
VPAAPSPFPSPFADSVRSHDWPRYIAVQFAPEAKRADLLTLYAFDAEVERITRIASDPLPGEIRLQWWREVLHGERADEGKSHPLATAMLKLVHDHRLPLDAFDRYIEAQTFSLYHDAFPDTLALEAWCGETASAFIQMASVILDPAAARSATEAAGHGGVALAISGILTRLPLTRARGQCFLPQDLLSACGLDRESFVAGGDGSAMARASKAMAELGLGHAAKFKALSKQLPKTLKPAFLPIATAPLVLKRAAAKPDTVHKASVTVTQLHKFLALAFTAAV